MRHVIASWPTGSTCAASTSSFSPGTCSCLRRRSSTGVTVHYVDEGLDTGEVIRQEEVPVEPRDTLEDRIHAVEHRILPEVVRELSAR